MAVQYCIGVIRRHVTGCLSLRLSSLIVRNNRDAYSLCSSRRHNQSSPEMLDQEALLIARLRDV